MTWAVLWYLNRATGMVALVLMTATILLGAIVRRQAGLPGPTRQHDQTFLAKLLQCGAKRSA